MTPTPSTFSKVQPYKWEAYYRTNGRRTAVQMGAVQLYCSSDTKGGRTAVRIGGVLQYGS